MTAYLVRRLLLTVPILVGALVLSFVVLHLLPGGPGSGWLQGRALSPTEQQRLSDQLGLDEPLPQRLLDYLTNLAHGDLGTSTRIDQPVSTRIVEQLPATLELALAATVVALVVGLGVGLLAGATRYRWVDAVFSGGSLVGISIPTFWFGLILITVVSFQLGLLPATGSSSSEALVLPAIALAVGPAGLIAQLLRDSLRRVLREPFIVTARAKGLRHREVVLRHALRNAMLPVITITGLTLGSLITSAVVVEEVFGRQGLGRLLVDGILNRDIPLVQGIVLLIALSYLAINLLIDILYAVVDPRVRGRRTA